MKAELEQLIALQNTDTNIRRLQAELDAIPQRRAEIEREFEQRASEFRALEATRDEAKATRVRLETELVETRARAERAERNLMSSRNEQEYGAAIREIDAARKHISQLETQILEKMEVIEKSERALAEREPEISKLRAELEAKVSTFEAQARAWTAELAASRAAREELVARMPKTVSALYNRVSARMRDGIAVAEARNGSCTACSMVLRPQVMAQVRRGEEVLTCDNCNRILYYAAPDLAQNVSPISAV